MAMWYVQGIWERLGSSAQEHWTQATPKALRDAGGYASDVLAAINHAIIDDIVDVTGLHYMKILLPLLLLLHKRRMFLLDH